MRIKLLFSFLLFVGIVACQNAPPTPEPRPSTPTVSQPVASPLLALPASNESPELPIAFALDGIRHGLVSPLCEENTDPACGPTQMYVGETLALSVHPEFTGWGFEMPSEQFDDEGPHPMCDYASRYLEESEPHGIDYFRRESREKHGPASSFEWFKMCYPGKASVLYRNYDREQAHHVEVFAMPSGIEQHPNIPTPTPTLTPAQVRKAESLEERFKTVTAKTNDEVFQRALLTVAFTCPAYANSKGFEINEKLTEKYHKAGLAHLFEAKEQGQSMKRIWAMVQDDLSQAEAYVEILEWGYGELAAMIKKPGSSVATRLVGKRRSLRRTGGRHWRLIAGPLSYWVSLALPIR